MKLRQIRISLLSFRRIDKDRKMSCVFFFVTEMPFFTNFHEAKRTEWHNISN